jgi:sugar/nucleoside kinase (ribokinase family)
MNEDEMAQFAPDPLTMAAMAMAAGVKLLVVTLGPRGVVYFAAPGFDGWAEGRNGGRAGTSGGDPLPPSRLPAIPPDGGPIRTALLPAPSVDAVDPTGCGDVFGAALCARLVAGDRVETAIHTAQGLAARNATLRGATTLGRLLKGELAVLGASA